jgi:outer membrane protein assembly factor BamB
MKKYLFFIAVLLPVFLPSCKQSNAPQAVENSQWRGENRDGIYNETGLLKEWPADGPQLLWSYEGLGDGFTSVAIANERLYITGFSDSTLLLFVFDLNGQLLVKKEVANEESENYPGPRSTVCINDGKMYLYNSFGWLICLDETTLEEVWSKDVITGFDGRNIDWRVVESPLIVGEKIFITPGGEQNNMVALNKNTGEFIWSSPGEGTVSAYCSPQYIGDQSIPIVVTSTAQYIVAFNADTGEKLWSFPQSHEFNIHPNTPLYHNGMVLSPTGYKVGATMLRLIDGGKAVEQVWKNEEMDNQMGGAVKIGDYVYGSGHFSNNWFCVDWNTGETKYREREIGRSNVISADGMLYCYSDRGKMYLVKPNPEKFELTGSFDVTLGTAQHWAHPVIHKGVLYIRHGDALMAYKIQ